MVGYWLVTKAAPTIKEKTKQTGITSTKNCSNTKGSFSCIRQQGRQGSAKDDCCVFCFLACLHVTQRKKERKQALAKPGGTKFTTKMLILLFSSLKSPTMISHIPHNIKSIIIMLGSLPVWIHERQPLNQKLHWTSKYLNVHYNYNITLTQTHRHAEEKHTWTLTLWTSKKIQKHLQQSKKTYPDYGS